MSKSTPGPWTADIVVNPQTRIAYPWAIWKDGVRLARIDSRPLAVRHEEAANARLIAKAPEMLAFIKHLLDDGIILPNESVGKDARALLREIEGP